MTMLLLNDLHFGIKRGPKFQEFQLEMLDSILEDNDDDLLIVGDLFDTHQIDYELLRTLTRRLRGRKVMLMLGNHDIAKDRGQLDAARFLAWMLPGSTLVEAPTEIGDIALIPHMANQEEFDTAITIASKRSTTLIAHCNFDNFFATAQDHSLNLTPEQAKLFDMVILGHEHVKRHVGNVHVLGSPWPCNIQEAEHDHYVHRFDMDRVLTAHEVWDKHDFEAMDWRDLRETGASFIRVVGEATAEEAAEVIQRVAAFKKVSDALMITNSVQVGELDLGELLESAESLDTFDPIAALMSALPEKYRKRLEEILETLT